MKKTEFLYRLDELLEALPSGDAKRSLDYYGEMIDERVESGMSEEEAVAELGSPESIAEQILGEVAPCTPKRTRKRSPLTIILLILGSPVWLSLLIAAVAVILSLYVSLWAVIISLWAAQISIAVSTPTALVCAVGYFCGGEVISGIAMIGGALVLAGLSIFMFYGCRTATKGTLALTKKIAIGIKKRLSKKEAV